MKPELKKILFLAWKKINFPGTIFMIPGGEGKEIYLSALLLRLSYKAGGDANVVKSSDYFNKLFFFQSA